MNIARSVLLKSLESVSPGLSPRETIEQGTSFVFHNGELITFNDNICCRTKSPFGKTISGAVQASKLSDILAKFPDDELEVTTKDNELRIAGDKRGAGICMESELHLPVDQVEKPGTFQPLAPDFIEAIERVKECAGTDESKFSLTCIHIHPKWMEACDGFQLIRHKIKSGVKESVLVRRDSIKHLAERCMTEFSETSEWLHFRNEDGLTLSCRRYVDVEDYPDLTPLIEVKGEPLTLPKDLADAVERTEVFSSDNAEYNHVNVELRPGKVKIRGECSQGWFEEFKKVEYKGKSLVFRISPRMLIDITKKYNDCVVSDTRLAVVGENFKYCCCLGSREENNGDADAPESTEA